MDLEELNVGGDADSKKNFDMVGVGRLFLEPAPDVYSTFIRGNLEPDELHAKIAFFTYCVSEGAEIDAWETQMHILSSRGYRGEAEERALTAVAPGYSYRRRNQDSKDKGFFDRFKKKKKNDGEAAS